MCISLLISISILGTMLSSNLVIAFNEDEAIYSLNWQEFKHDPKPADYESVIMRTSNNEQYNCHVPTKVKEKFNASDTFVVDQAALEAARWLLLPLFNAESPREESKENCWQVSARTSLPGEFWHRRRNLVYELCSIGDGGQVRLINEDGGDVWNIGGFPDGGADNIAAALRPGPPGSFVEVDNNRRLAFVELKLDVGGDSCRSDADDEARSTVSTILRLACGTKPGLVSAVQVGPCQHLLLLLTPLLCGYASFRPSPARVNHIACRRVSPPVTGSGTASRPPRSLVQLEASRDRARLLNQLAFGGESKTKKLRLGQVGDGSTETVVFLHSGLPWILEDEENEDNFW